MADQPSGYAVLGQPGQPVVKADSGMHWGGSAVWVLIWVVVIIIIIALLASLFTGGDWWGSSSSDEDSHNKKKHSWNLDWLGGLVIFVVVLLFLCWMLSAASGYGRQY